MPTVRSSTEHCSSTSEAQDLLSASSDIRAEGQQEQDIRPAECRICRETDPPLTKPCLCVAPVHPTCLATWLQQRQTFFPLRASRPACEVCLGVYELDGNDSDAESSGEGWWWKGGREGAGFLSNLAGRTSIGISVENCLLMFVFVLGATGHGIYLLWMYGDGWAGRVEAYVIERFALGVVNAALTAAFIFLFKKAVAKWIATVEADFMEAESWRVIQVIVGIVLSVVAAFEVFMLLSLAGV